MTVRKCEFKNDWMVMMVDESDLSYNTFKNLFEHMGLAFADLENKFIVLDGKEIKNQNLSKDHISAIEAHEIGHFASDHVGAINKSLERLEKEADWAGHQILLKYKKTKAAKLLAERFKDKYEAEITEYDVSGTERYKIQNFLNEIKNI